MRARDQFDIAIRGDARGATGAFRSVERSTQSIDRSFGKAEKSAKRFSREMVAGVGAVSTAIATVGIGRMVEDAVRAADQVDKMAIASGIAREEFQRLDFAANQLGVSTSSLEGMLGRFNKRVGEFMISGRGAGAQSLEELGLAARIVSGELPTTEAALRATFVELDKVEDISRKTALAAGLFGVRAGGDLVKLLAEGVDGMQYWMDQASVMSEQAVKDAVRINDRWTAMTGNMRTTWRGFILETISLWDQMIGRLGGDLRGFSTDKLRDEVLLLDAELNRMRREEMERERGLGDPRANRDSARSRAAREERRAEIEARKAEVDALLKQRERLENPPPVTPSPGGSGGGGAASTLAKEQEKAARRASDALDDLVRKHGEWVEQTEFEISLLGKSEKAQRALTDARAVEERDLARRLAAIEAGRDSNAEYMAMLDELAAEEMRLLAVQRRRTAEAEASAEATDRNADATRQMTSALSSQFATIRSGRDAIDSLLDLALQGLFGQGAFGGIGNALFGVDQDGIIGAIAGAPSSSGGGGGSLITLLTSGLKLYGKGGVSNEPAVFGEAGPEAAVPLPDGRRIPVDLRGGMMGGGVNITIHNNAGAEVTPTVSETENGLDIELLIDQVVADKISRRGSFTSRALASRGAMERR